MAFAVTYESDTGGGGGTVEPSEQDPGCHSAALASASNSVEGFRWNGEGMDVYRSEYDACMDIIGG